MEVDVPFIVFHDDFIRWESGQEDDTPCSTSYPYFRESFYAWSFSSFEAPILGQQYCVLLVGVESNTMGGSVCWACCRGPEILFF